MSMRSFNEMKQLYNKAEEDFCKALDLLVLIWKVSVPDSHVVESQQIIRAMIEAYFLEHGGIMIDGKFMFKKKNPDVYGEEPPLCIDCGKDYSDPPSKRCPGCEAYMEHQS